MENHRHDENGDVILQETESPEEAEARAAARAAEASADASVEIARIEADRDVTVARMETKAVDTELAAQLAAALAELEALKAARLPADPEPAAVIIDAPAVSTEPSGAIEEDLPPADHSEHSERPRRKTGLGMW